MYYICNHSAFFILSDINCWVNKPRLHSRKWKPEHRLDWQNTFELRFTYPYQAIGAAALTFKALGGGAARRACGRHAITPTAGDLPYIEHHYRDTIDKAFEPPVNLLRAINLLYKNRFGDTRLKFALTRPPHDVWAEIGNRRSQIVCWWSASASTGSCVRGVAAGPRNRCSRWWPPRGAVSSAACVHVNQK